MFVNKYPPYIPLPKDGRLLVIKVYFIIRYAKKKKQTRRLTHQTDQ